MVDKQQLVSIQQLPDTHYRTLGGYRELPCILCGEKALYRVGNHGLYCAKHRAEAIAHRGRANNRITIRAALTTAAFVPEHISKLPRGIARVIPRIPVAAESVKLTRREFVTHGRNWKPRLMKKCSLGKHAHCLSPNCTCDCHQAWRSK